MACLTAVGRLESNPGAFSDLDKSRKSGIRKTCQEQKRRLQDDLRRIGLIIISTTRATTKQKTKIYQATKRADARSRRTTKSCWVFASRNSAVGSSTARKSTRASTEFISSALNAIKSLKISTRDGSRKQEPKTAFVEPAPRSKASTAAQL